MKLDTLLKVANKFENLLAAKDRGDCVFEVGHPKNKSTKEHFPLNNLGQARSALSRVNGFSSAPDWYNGSLESLINSVYRAVKKKFPSIEIDQKKKSPGKD